jgi:hypothetical protein
MRSALSARSAGAALLASAVLLTLACSGDPANPAAPSPAIISGDQAVMQPKVDICHRTEGANPWIPLSLVEAAVAAHLAHGDGLVGSAVPGMAGMKFGADCSLVALAPILDQSNITYLSFGGDGAPGSAVSPSQAVAQTLTVGISGVLAKIDLGLYRYPDATTGDVTLDIMPAGVFPAYNLSSSLFTTTIAISSIPLLTTDLTSIDVSAGNISVKSDDQLAIVLRRPSGPSWVIWQDSNSPYAGGSSFTWHPGWTAWHPVGGDYRFQTWVLP